jgi:sec-independent protein translocase protein TatC
LICTIVGAAISPTPDPFNMMLVAIPMYALYEVGAIASYFALPRGERGRFWRRPKLAA